MRNFKQIVAIARRNRQIKRVRSGPKTIRGYVTQYRSGVRWMFIKPTSILRGWVKDLNKEEDDLPRFTEEELGKLKEALKLIDDVMDRRNWNENTQKIVKSVEEYDSSKSNR